MSPLLTAVVSFVLMLLGCVAAVHVRRVLPDRHFSEDARDIVRLGAGLMATISALVLSLLISSASNAYEAQRREVREIAANVVLLDALLTEYGPATRPIREGQRAAVDTLVNNIWRTAPGGGDPERGFMPAAIAHNLHEAIRALKPETETQRELRTQAIQVAVDTARARYMLYEGSDSRLPTPFVFIVIGWLATLFMSFCLFSQPNRIAVVALVVLAMSTASALFLLLELSDPFGGLLSIPDRPLRHALPPLDG
ncbi:MAG: hypothetical protein Q8L22_06135 [Reyranella sp.]|nr:hypothetical protein [Reyranella sp.]